LKEKDEKIKELRERLNPNKEEFKPVKCSYCGFEKVYKNGIYRRRPKEFFDTLKRNEQKEERIQNFLCPWCGKSFRIEKKGGLLPLPHKK